MEVITRFFKDHLHDANEEHEWLFKHTTLWISQMNKHYVCCKTFGFGLKLKKAQPQALRNPTIRNLSEQKFKNYHSYLLVIKYFRLSF